MKTSELTDNALDWAVEVALVVGRVSSREQAVSIASSRNKVFNVGYSTNWASGGPIIDANPTMQFWVWGGRPDYRPGELQCASMAAIVHGGTQHKTWFGKTKLIAAMRCYVASKLGDEIEIPKELL
jgi:hypothetical protein